MRNAILIAAASLAVGGAFPAFAQSGQTQTPTAPNAGNSAPQTQNSLPPGAGNTPPSTNNSAYPTLNSGTSTTTVTPSR